MIKNKAILLNANKINRTLVRLAHEIVEKNSNLDELAIIGIRTRGDFIANRIALIIKEITKTEINKGNIDGL